MDLRNTESGLGESVERLVTVIEFERKVAGVVVDSDVFGETVGSEFASLTPGEEAFEEGDGFLGVFEVA